MRSRQIQHFAPRQVHFNASTRAPAPVMIAIIVVLALFIALVAIDGGSDTPQPPPS